jgi:hypothetical protein
MIDHCFKILDQAIEGNLLHFALRKSKATPVVAQQGMTMR